MTIVLHVEPKTFAMNWEEFCKKKPSFSIALDGYVNTGPKFDVEGPRSNFNHHENVDRLATRATCAQILMAIRQGLFACYSDKFKRVNMHIYVNDCDEDVCTSVFLLRNGHLAEHAINPVLNKLVSLEDALDSTAGAYPFPPNLPVLSQLAWVFEPYRKFRASNQFNKKESSEYESIITDVENRILCHITGTGKSLDLDLRWKKLGGGSVWTMIEETGQNAKTGMFASGIMAYVSVRKHSDDNKWTYTVGRMSPFIPFDVEKILKALNEAEGLTLGKDDCWGGGNTIGGSPRVNGSSLDPETVSSIVSSIVE